MDLQNTDFQPSKMLKLKVFTSRLFCYIYLHKYAYVCITEVILYILHWFLENKRIFNIG